MLGFSVNKLSKPADKVYVAISYRDAALPKYSFVNGVIERICTMPRTHAEEVEFKTMSKYSLIVRDVILREL